MLEAPNPEAPAPLGEILENIAPKHSNRLKSIYRGLGEGEPEEAASLTKIQIENLEEVAEAMHEEAKEEEAKEELEAEDEEYNEKQKEFLQNLL